MMNKTFTFKMTCMAICCLMAFPTLQAQTTGGPDAFGYIWRDSNDPSGPTFNWVDIVGAPDAVQVTGLADDNLRGPFAVGFPFRFYWYDVTTFRVGSNGYIGFNNQSTAHPFPLIPDPTGIQNYLPAMATDLTFTDVNNTAIPGTECWYRTTPGGDSLIVSYINVPFWVAGAPGYIGTNTFQIILSTADSSITYQYQLQSGGSNNIGSFCTVGIENISGNIGLMHSNNIYPPSTYAIKFYYPSNTNYQVSDAATAFNNNETTGGLFRSANGAPYVMEARVRNSGNQSLAAFSVNSRVVNFLNQNQVTSTVSSNALVPGDFQDIVFPDLFNPVTPGAYRHINTTQLVGDATPSNNEKQLELQIVDTTQASITLSFDTGVDAGLGGLSWSGGSGGAGMHFIPPFHPCDLTQIRIYITANPNLVGYSIHILADNGPNGTPGTVLYSDIIGAASVIPGAWNVVQLTAPQTINSGGFYVAWMMGGDGISLGQNQVAPISNRTYEVLGSPSNPLAWADYRYRELEDLMINAVITDTPVGLNDPDNAEFVGQLYPNPASDYARLDFNIATKSQLVWAVNDLTGKLIMNGKQAHQGGTSVVSFDASKLSNGIYTFMMTDGVNTWSRKLSVVK